ncbi:MAG TPA: transporter substrate-binding domain-containing protein [Pseudonocardiaceae bacterium]|jgi:polar amino acid transport system substrate-binding protein|nr:transporter substrate-binding domain-containing protein [Pseudonocardiaceae bacterium]
MGIGEVQATTVDFNSLIPALNARQFDIVCAGMNITPKRCAQAAFSIPDYSARTAFLVPAGNPQQVRTFADLVTKDLTVAVLSAAVEQGYAADSGVPRRHIQVFGDQNALLQAVTAGRTYCASLTDISLKWLMRQHEGVPVEVTPGFIPIINGQPVVSAGGFVFRQADTDLRQAFDTQLRALPHNGRWVQIAAPFGFSAANLPGDLTTAQLCGTG